MNLSAKDCDGFSQNSSAVHKRREGRRGQISKWDTWRLNESHAGRCRWRQESFSRIWHGISGIGLAVSSIGSLRLAEGQEGNRMGASPKQNELASSERKSEHEQSNVEALTKGDSERARTLTLFNSSVVAIRRLKGLF